MEVMSYLVLLTLGRELALTPLEDTANPSRSPRTVSSPICGVSLFVDSQQRVQHAGPPSVRPPTRQQNVAPGYRLTMLERQADHRRYALHAQHFRTAP
ncbi:hypothetical protein C8Q77DRAFT_1138546 [Trametes polyzona]|nr:hypothetical protein C8Q77DRAFT_1138546 [Trametes polyzona]